MGHLLVGMNDVKTVPHSPAAVPGEKKLVQPVGLIYEFGNFVKSDVFLPLKGPFVGENVDIMAQGHSPGHLQGISLGTACRNKALNKNCDLESPPVEHGECFSLIPTSPDDRVHREKQE
jgi:hypothetical protein